jgi:hypothetical protein
MRWPGTVVEPGGVALVHRREHDQRAQQRARDWYGAEFVNGNSRSWSWSVPLGSGSRTVGVEYKFSFSTNPSNARDSLHFEVNGEPSAVAGCGPVRRARSRTS